MGRIARVVEIGVKIEIGGSGSVIGVRLAQVD
jgi:hypothetical protein